MASIEEIKQRIAVANGESKRLNNERQVSIGKRDALTSQLTTLFAKYKEEYGIELTKDNVDTELQRVLAEKEKEVEQIENVLNLINSGNYADAQKLTVSVNNEPEQPAQGDITSFQSTMTQEVNASISTQAVTETIPSQPTSVPVQSVTESVIPPTQPSVPTPPIQTSVPAGGAQGVVSSSVTPPTVSTPEVPTPPTPPTPSVNNTGISALNGFSEPVGNVAPPTPPTVEEPKQSVSPTSFNAILSGTAFNPSN